MAGRYPADTLAHPGVFLTHAEMTDSLAQVERRYPDLVERRVLTETSEGRSVWIVEIAAQRDHTPLAHRPGYLAVGNHHAIELSGSALGLYLLDHLTRNYGKDSGITQLLNEHVIYIVPRVAVDGAEHILQTMHDVRSDFVKVKERNVPYPEDLNGDGRILQMRWQDSDGDKTTAPEDSRIMLDRTAKDTTGPFYHVATEGRLHEWDGETVGSSSARNDFNRNYPANWEPHYYRLGQGRYPLSEEETQALADFVLAHPNLTATTDFHTGNPVVWYPQAARDEVAAYSSDTDLYARIGSVGVEATGYPYQVGYGRPAHYEIPGMYIDWTYQQRGMISFIMEMGNLYNFLDLPEARTWVEPGGPYGESQLRLLEWDRNHSGFDLFFEWQEFDHPQLGTVELGGWNRILWRNPPPEHLETICSRMTEFALHLADLAPELKVTEPTVEQLASNLYKISARAINRGELSTRVTGLGGDTQLGTEPVFALTGSENLRFVVGQSAVRLSHLGSNDRSREVVWVIRTESNELRLPVSSDRGWRDETVVSLE